MEIESDNLRSSYDIKRSRVLSEMSRSGSGEKDNQRIITYRSKHVIKRKNEEDIMAEVVAYDFVMTKGIRY